MSDTGFVHPPPPPPPPPAPPYQAVVDAPSGADPGRSPLSEPARSPRRSRRFRAVAGGTAAVVVAVTAAGGILAFRLLHGGGDTLVGLVPADTALYVNINFDPSAGQKLAVNGLLGKFPGLSDQSRTDTVNGWLDKAFAGSGLTYKGDIAPWLGSDISVAMPASPLLSLTPGATLGRSATPDVAVLVACRDDGKAQAALDKFRTGSAGSAIQWTTTMHGGVPVTSATANGSGGAYAITDHVVVFASSVGSVDSIIDTAQGSRANLQSSSSFATVDSQLPSDRLATAYVDVAALLQRLGVSAQLNSARAYRGVGLALVAASDGLTLAGTEDYDVAQLTPAQRAALAIPPHPNGSLGYVPRSAYGVMALSGVQQALNSAVDTLAPPGSSTARSLLQFSITGASGILAHLTGDAGIEVDHVPGHTTPAGAALLDTDSTPVTQGILDNMVASICTQSSSCDAAAVITQTDQGVTISSIPLSGTGSSGVEPSWAVKDGWAIIASSPDEVRAVLDSHASGVTIATSPTYTAVTSHAGSSNNGMFYVDVAAVTSAIRGVLPPSEQASFDSNVAPYLNPIKALEMSTQNATDHTSFSLFVLIP